MPWDTQEHDKVTIILMTQEISEAMSKQEKCIAALTGLSKLPTMHLQFGTDESVTSELHGTGAALLFELNPLFSSHGPKHHCIPQKHLCLCQRLLMPTGLLEPSELDPINLSLRYILAKVELFQAEIVFIASDSFSCLTALAAGPLCPFKVAGIDCLVPWELLLWATHVCSHIYLHYIPGYVRIEQNENADETAKRAVAAFSLACQHPIIPVLLLIQMCILHTFQTQWMQSLERPLTLHRHVLQTSFSSL